MSVAISPCQAADFQTLYEIDQACYPPGIAYSRRVLRAFLRLPGASCLVARPAASSQGPAAGFIIFQAQPPAGRIITIDVLEPFRRCGIGSALLGAAEEQLAAGGVGTVELETATSNAAAIAFWQSHGYRKTGVLPGYYLGRLDAWKMRKRLPVGHAWPAR